MNTAFFNSTSYPMQILSSQIEFFFTIAFSTQQVKQGTRVSAKNLRSGDIVFFKPGNRTNHTAVYVGNTLFINASSSKGVVMSSLKSPYWRKYFRYGVRVHNV